MFADRRAVLTAIAASAFAPAAFARPPYSYPAPDRELMVPVTGGNVYVRVNGDLGGPRPPLVALHGGPGGSHGGLLDLLALADERAVILYDQLDSGRSDHPEDPANWTVERFTGELEAIRAALGVSRWHVFGHSWGGTVAMEYGARRPPELAGLILASPMISARSWKEDADALRERLPDGVQADLDRCETPEPPPQPVCAAATQAFYAAFNRREMPSDGLIAYFRSSSIGRGDNMRVYNAMWGPNELAVTGTLRDYDGEPLLDRLDGPRTLFIVGQYDEATPATVDRFASHVPGAEFAVVPGAAHGFFSDRPAETIGILRPWLARQDNP